MRVSMSGVIVVGNAAAGLSDRLTRCRPDPAFIDPVRLRVDAGRIPARCDSVCW